MVHEAHPDGFRISTDKSLIDLEAVHAFLSGVAYWSLGLPRETLARAIAGSICFGVYHEPAEGTGEGPRQVGFARVITDAATYAYLADVYILEPYRGRGLSTWLMEVILAHPDLQGLRRFALITRDAHGLYRRFGFQNRADPTGYMELVDREVYTRPNRL